MKRGRDRLDLARLLLRLEGDAPGKYWLCYDCVALHYVRALPDRPGTGAGLASFTDDWDDPDVHAHLDALALPADACTPRPFAGRRRSASCFSRARPAAAPLPAPHGLAAAFLRTVLEPALADPARRGLGPPPGFRWWGYAGLRPVPRPQRVWRAGVGLPLYTGAVEIRGALAPSSSSDAGPRRRPRRLCCVARHYKLSVNKGGARAAALLGARVCRHHFLWPAPAVEQGDVERWTDVAGRRAVPALRAAWRRAGWEAGAPREEGGEDDERDGVRMRAELGEVRERGEGTGRSLRDAVVLPLRGESKPLARLDPAHDAIWLDAPPDMRGERVFGAACGKCTTEVFWSVSGQAAVVGASPPFSYALFEMVSVKQIFEVVDGDGGGSLVPLLPAEVESQEEIALRRWFERELVDLLEVQWSWYFGCPAPEAEYGPDSLATLES
jgi:hypothetical protein